MVDQNIWIAQTVRFKWPLLLLKLIIIDREPLNFSQSKDRWMSDCCLISELKVLIDFQNGTQALLDPESFLRNFSERDRDAGTVPLFTFLKIFENEISAINGSVICLSATGSSKEF